MKTKLEHCSKCGEETLNDVGKKQAGDRSGKHYTKRTTSRCRSCNTRIIDNRKRGKRILIERDGSEVINKVNRSEDGN